MLPRRPSWYLVACAAGAVLLLLILIARVRLHPALALAVAALTLGVAAGMPLKQVPLSFTAGVGNLMGHIAIILGLAPSWAACRRFRRRRRAGQDAGGQCGPRACPGR